MNTSEYRLIDPLDVPVARGNRLFDNGVHGESLTPPWPRVFAAGVVASRALAQRVGQEGKPLLDSLSEDIRKGAGQRQGGRCAGRSRAAGKCVAARRHCCGTSGWA